MTKVFIIMGICAILLGGVVLLIVLLVQKHKEKKRLEAYLRKQQEQKRAEQEEEAQKAKLEREKQETKRRMEKYLSSELMQRFMNDCTNYIINEISRWGENPTLSELRGSWFVYVGQDKLQYGEYRSGSGYIVGLSPVKIYSMNEERYDLIPKTDIKNLADAVSNAIVIKLKNYFTYHTFRKDSSIKINYGYFKQYFNHGETPGTAFISNEIVYSAKNGYFIPKKSW